MILRKNGYRWVGVKEGFTEEECEEVIELCQGLLNWTPFLTLLGDKFTY